MGTYEGLGLASLEGALPPNKAVHKKAFPTTPLASFLYVSIGKRA